MPKKIIYAEDAIDALADYIHNVNKVMGNGKLSAWDCADAAWSVLGDLPSAQPEKRTEERTETHARDLIDRQAAVDALVDDLSYYGSGDERAFGMSRAIGIVEKLPSA